MVALRVRVRASSGRAVGFATLCALIGTLLAPPPSARAATLLLDPASGPPGTIVDATANGFLSGPVTFWWDNTILLGTDPLGRVRRLTFTVPSNADPGPHVVRACQGSACPPGAVYDDATFAIPEAPKPTLRATPRATPQPTAGPPATAPPTSGGAGSPAASGDGVAVPPGSSPSAAAPGGVAVPSTNPAGDPSAPGTVKVQFHWDREGVAIAVVLGLLALLFILWRNNVRALKSRTGHALIGGGSEKWMRDNVGKSFLRPKRPKPKLTGLVPGDSDPKPAAPPEPASPLLAHEASHTGQGPTPPPPQVPPVPMLPITPSDGDVTLKGSKIKEN